MYASLDMIRRIKQLNREVDLIDKRINETATDSLNKDQLQTKRSRLVALKDALLQQWHQLNY